MNELIILPILISLFFLLESYLAIRENGVKFGLVIPFALPIFLLIDCILFFGSEDLFAVTMSWLIFLGLGIAYRLFQSREGFFVSLLLGYIANIIIWLLYLKEWLLDNFGVKSIVYIFIAFAILIHFLVLRRRRKFSTYLILFMLCTPVLFLLFFLLYSVDFSSLK